MDDGRDDRALVAGLVAGDARAFDVAWDRHRGRIHAFLWRLAGRSDVAEELVQETFLRLATHARTLPPDTSLAAWLFTVARNLCLSWRRWRIVDELSLARWGHGARSTTTHGPHEHAEASQLGARLEAALAALPPRHREVLLLVAVERLAPFEAAQVLGISAESLRQRLSRARALLVTALGEPLP